MYFFLILLEDISFQLLSSLSENRVYVCTVCTYTVSMFVPPEVVPNHEFEPLQVYNKHSVT